MFNEDYDLTDLPIFPIEFYPAEIIEFAYQVSKTLNAPVDLIGTSILAVASTAIGMTRKVELRSGWHQACNMYIGIIGDPSMKKSPAMRYAVRPLERINAQNFAQYETDKAAYEAEMEIRKSAPKEMKRAQEQQPEPDKPTFAQVIAENATSEAVTRALSWHPRGLMKFHDELGQFFKSMGEYKNGKGADDEFYLAIFNNRLPVRNRVNEEPLVVAEEVFLNVFGATTPETIRKLMAKHNGTGMSERFLWASPKMLPFEPLDIDNLPQIDAAAVVAYDSIITKLYERCKFTEGKYDRGTAVMLTLSKEAQRVFITIENYLTQMAMMSGTPDHLKGAYIKLNSYVGRIAIVLHTIKQAATDDFTNNVIDETTMQHAVQLTGYFKRHIEYVMGFVQATETDQLTAKIIDRIATHGSDHRYGKVLKFRDIYRGMNLVKEEVMQVLEHAVRDGHGAFDFHENPKNKKQPVIYFILHTNEDQAAEYLKDQARNGLHVVK
jgi:hypothetical protein